ncbi:MAG: membrane protein insertion efficiency factor YidD [Thermodesulfobacteriota bacterium]
MRWLIAAAIVVYQRALSPFLPPSCRFYPSCSEYTKGCVIRHGVLKGLWLGARRLLKCHPLHPGGCDPVP